MQGKVGIIEVLEVVHRIRDNCVQMDKIKEVIDRELDAELRNIENQTEALISEMENKYADYEQSSLGYIIDEVDRIVKLLTEDYKKQFNLLTVDVESYDSFTVEENEDRLKGLIAELNSAISELNSLDFDLAVPPLQIEIKDDHFITYTGNHQNEIRYGGDAKVAPVRKIDVFPELAERIYSVAKRIKACVKAIIKLTKKQFDISKFKAAVKKKAKAWVKTAQTKATDGYEVRYNQLFAEGGEKAISSNFFEQMQTEGAALAPSMAGSEAFCDRLAIGEARIRVSEEQSHLNYFMMSSVLGKYMPGGYLSAPLIMDMKKCGNILLNVDEDDYNDKTVSFINSLIIQYLLSFPADKIKFCFIDVDNKIGFSQFYNLKKISNSILFGSDIIRDDRAVENCIKDMEQAMHHIQDSILSFNSVSDIFEYNSRFEANQQCVHIFVYVNFPSGINEALAKRVQKIVEGGNNAGVFSIIVNNKKQLETVYKKEIIEKILESIAKRAIVIDKNGDEFGILMDGENLGFSPRTDLDISMLGSIIDNLKETVATRNVAIPELKMFEAVDAFDRRKRSDLLASEVLDIPIGMRGGEVQTLELRTNAGSPHCLAIGASGWGKSNLLHSIILGACYRYSPEELNLYIVDFKSGNGIEFHYYTNKVLNKGFQLPHIRLAGLSGSPEDGVAILRNLDKEMERRMKEIKMAGAADIIGYWAKGKRMPRLMVIIDELPILIEQNERLGDEAVSILTSIIRQARAAGINLIFGAQTVPNRFGNVLGQIGVRICLHVNSPDEEAHRLGMDSKLVGALCDGNERGKALIKDDRYGSESIEFRVALIERAQGSYSLDYLRMICDKWALVTNNIHMKPAYIVGAEHEPSALECSPVFASVPSTDSFSTKAFIDYSLHLGQNYITGEEYVVSDNPQSILVVGDDKSVALRDTMGYALLSVVMENATNAASRDRNNAAVYYANGEPLSARNERALLNRTMRAFSTCIKNYSSEDRFVNCIKEVYRIYIERRISSAQSEDMQVFAPCIILINSLQAYSNYFNSDLVYSEESEREASASTANGDRMDKALSDLFDNPGSGRRESNSGEPKLPQRISFCDAFSDLVSNAYRYGVHFIISHNDPSKISVRGIKDAIININCKIITPGVNRDVVDNLLYNFKDKNNVDLSKIALAVQRNELTKVRTYRFDDEVDSAWFNNLVAGYLRLLGGTNEQ